MTNTNLPTHNEKHNPATLWSIYTAIERIYEIADATLEGRMTQTRINETGHKVQVPFTHKDALEFICDQATFVLVEIDELKHQIKALTVYRDNTEREHLTLPAAD